MKNRIAPSTLLGMVCMLVFWTMTPLAIPYVKEHFSLLFQIWIRYFSSVVFLWVLASRQKTFKDDMRKAWENRGSFLLMVLPVAIFTLFFQLLYTYCFFLVTPTFGLLLYQSQVLFSLLWGVLLFGSERHLVRRPGTVIGIIMAIGGAVAVISFSRNGLTAELNIGVLMAIGAALSWSFNGVFLNKGGSGRIYSPQFVVSVVFTLVVIILGPILFFAGKPHIGEPSSTHWIVLIGTGILGIAGGQGLYYTVLPKIGIVVAASIQLLIPLLSGIASYFIYQERLTPLQIIGGIILLAGAQLILIQKSRASAN